MQLKSDSVVTHLSHYFHLISAYDLTEVTFNALLEEIDQAMKKATETKESVIVTQDSVDHILVVHPSKAITLYASMGTFEKVEEKPITIHPPKETL